MKRMIIIALALFVTTAVSFAQEKKENQKHGHHMTTKQKYTCSMHPEVKSDKPGKCSKCGMDLIEKK